MKIIGWLLLLLGGCSLGPSYHNMEFDQAVFEFFKFVGALFFLLLGAKMVDTSNERSKND